MIKLKISNVDAELKKLQTKADKQLKENSQVIVKNLEKELILATPVDTGFARESWKTVETKKGFDVTNSAPYIEHLNEGSSQQAPARFIESVALKYGKPFGTIVTVIDSNKSQ